MIAVDLTPASARPYVGSSGTNSELDLALGYNGIQRLLGMVFGRGGGSTSGSSIISSITSGTDAAGGPGGASENGVPGFFRLLNTQLGGQVSWLLALGVVGLLATGWGIRWNGQSLVAARAILAPFGGGAAQRPPDAATVGAGALGRLDADDGRLLQRRRLLSHLLSLDARAGHRRTGRHRRWSCSGATIAPSRRAGAAGCSRWRWSSRQSSRRSSWRTTPTGTRWMTPLIVGGSLTVAALLVWWRLAHAPANVAYTAYMSAPAIAGGSLPTPVYTPSRNSFVDRFTRSSATVVVATALGVALLLIGPATWVGVSLTSGAGGTLPTAGPTATLAQSGGSGGFGGGRGGFGGALVAGAGSLAVVSLVADSHHRPSARATGHWGRQRRNRWRWRRWRRWRRGRAEPPGESTTAHLSGGASRLGQLSPRDARLADGGALYHRQWPASDRARRLQWHRPDSER